MISRARPLCVLTNAISSSASGDELAVALEQLGGAENRLQRVVQLVRDAGHQHADRRQPLLPDDLPLQRLQRLAHLALLLDLAIERVVRFAQVRRHRDERVLQLRRARGSAPAFRGGGDRSPSAIRWTASRTPLTPRLISVDSHERERAATAPIATTAMIRLRRHSGATRASATLVGMPTLSSHGPRSTTALP